MQAAIAGFIRKKRARKQENVCRWIRSTALDGREGAARSTAEDPNHGHPVQAFSVLSFLRQSAMGSPPAPPCPGRRCLDWLSSCRADGSVVIAVAALCFSRCARGEREGGSGVHVTAQICDPPWNRGWRGGFESPFKI
jgi:hypothetical protein